MTKSRVLTPRRCAPAAPREPPGDLVAGGYILRKASLVNLLPAMAQEPLVT
jgi:hypothetical protein